MRGPVTDQGPMPDEHAARARARRRFDLGCWGCLVLVVLALIAAAAAGVYALTGDPGITIVICLLAAILIVLLLRFL